MTSVSSREVATSPDPAAGPRPADLIAVRILFASLAVLLAGYMFLGRGFAHVGRSPIYVSEVVLAVGLICTGIAVVRLRLSFVRSPILLLLIAFMALGFLRTVPYLGAYGVDALRDAVLWGYALFAIMVYLLVDRATLLAAIRLYGWIVPIFALWLPISWNVAGTLRGDIDPNAPAAVVPLVFFKSGDMAVHAVGSVAFLVLAAAPLASLWMLAWRTAVALPFVWTFYVTAAVSRGALLASVAGLGLLVVLRQKSRNWVPVLLATLVLVILIAPKAANDLRGCDPTGGSQDDGAAGREVSACQLVQNTGSILGTSAEEGLQGTKSFRLAWWTTIFDYTVRGPYFWTGKGFGINLADDDGFQPNADHSLRAPHNSHITALARMGVPGFILWTLLQAAFAIGLLRSLLAHRRAGDAAVAAVAGWILVYWLAMMVNTSFDPYLEGPQGGIWFWVLFGLGMVVIRLTPRRPET